VKKIIYGGKTPISLLIVFGWILLLLLEACFLSKKTIIVTWKTILKQKKVFIIF
jgi:hypothetical protein